MRKSSKSATKTTYRKDVYEVAHDAIRDNFLPRKRSLGAAIHFATQQCIEAGFDQKESYSAAAEFAELYCCGNDMR